jgi:hypothetical protein
MVWQAADLKRLEGERFVQSGNGEARSAERHH